MKSDKKPAILRILPGYAEKFRPKSLATPCKSLKNLYSDSCLNMPFQYLQKKCNEIFESISISQDEALNIESQTRSQSKSQKWYERSAGKITASVMKEACRTNLDIPSLSLIKKICYRVKFRSVATDWGIEHENPAKNVIFQFFQALIRI